MIVIPWCGKCAVEWRGTPSTVVATYSKHGTTRCPQCGELLARNAVKRAVTRVSIGVRNNG